MPVWSGKFRYLDSGDSAISLGPCQFQIDETTVIVTPSGGTSIAFDLGDVDRLVPGEWDVQLFLYDGNAVVLQQFGSAFSGMARELMAAWRDRTVACLLLEDLEENARYEGTANGAAAEIRIFKSNVAVLPYSGSAMQWRPRRSGRGQLRSDGVSDGARARRRAVGPGQVWQEDR